MTLNTANRLLNCAVNLLTNEVNVKQMIVENGKNSKLLVTRHRIVITTSQKYFDRSVK